MLISCNQREKELIFVIFCLINDLINIKIAEFSPNQIIFLA